MCKCLGNILLTVMSCLTLGICLAASIIMFVLVKTEKISEVTKSTEIILIVIIVLSAIILLFAIYASCCGRSCSRKVLGAIFIIFALVIVTMGLLMYFLTEKMLNNIYQIWEDGEHSNPEAVREIESALKCCGYNSTEGCAQGAQPCKDLLETEVYTRIYAIEIILFIILVMLIVSAVIACLKRCSGEEKVDNIP